MSTVYTPVIRARNNRGRIIATIAFDAPSELRLVIESMVENAEHNKQAIDARSFLIRFYKHSSVTITAEVAYDSQ